MTSLSHNNDVIGALCVCWEAMDVIGVIDRKTGGGVPRAAENWTLEDRGKNRFGGQTDRSNSGGIGTQKADRFGGCTPVKKGRVQS